MFVIRKKGSHSAKMVANDLGVETRFYPNPKYPNRMFDWRRDFFMTPVRHVVNAPTEYASTLRFAARNKYEQRFTLQENGISIPNCAGGQAVAATLTGSRFVVRPLRHSAGLGYRVTSDRLDFSPGTEYISELYPKRREYRVTFVFGKPLIWLRKKQNEGVSNEEPWGHANSKFQTINDIPACRLSSTDCVARLAALDIIKGSHLVAADIMYNPDADKNWVVLELNFCPSLEIDANRAKVVEAIRGRL